jgi:hypothetical protein
MRRTSIEHIISILLFAILFVSIAVFISPPPKSQSISNDSADFIPVIDPDEPLQKLILKESLELFYPAQQTRTDSILQAVAAGSQEIFLQSDDKTLTLKKIIQILWMYFKFILIYLIVLAITYYAAQSLAILKFIKMRQNRSSYLRLLINHFQTEREIVKKLDFSLLFKAIIKGVIFFILFSPAYVIAYSFKTRFDTDSILFMIILGVISNGLLISYTQKFFTFLHAESRKGYVNTARVKNLKNNYSTLAQNGITYRQIFALRKSFSGHVFEHIYKNAHFQYIASIKEQASYLISGLVIIEMALNIQGHLCYELLQNILYNNYNIVLLIVFLIFILLKLTEICIDYLKYRLARRYDNKVT